MMKLRKFYPSQVIRRLNGSRASELTKPFSIALRQGGARARKSGLEITIVNDKIGISEVRYGRGKWLINARETGGLADQMEQINKSDIQYELALARVMVRLNKWPVKKS